jgi:hypothetical protein
MLVVRVATTPEPPNSTHAVAEPLLNTRIWFAPEKFSISTLAVVAATEMFTVEACIGWNEIIAGRP